MRADQIRPTQTGLLGLKRCYFPAPAGVSAHKSASKGDQDECAAAIITTITCERETPAHGPAGSIRFQDDLAPVRGRTTDKCVYLANSNKCSGQTSEAGCSNNPPVSQPGGRSY
ncbi:hypothetical protein Bbelb_149930 [Branchiostoma belcheri]|nr:hypothetical protein Bbelb_149930 [Branchiostoma belcheri]